MILANSYGVGGLATAASDRLDCAHQPTSESVSSGAVQATVNGRIVYDIDFHYGRNSC